MKTKKIAKAGLGFVEIVIAVLVISACAVPVVYMVTSSRTDTTKAINYLRAVELANEVIEWASVAEFSKLDAITFAALTRSLVDETSGNDLPVSLAVVAPNNQVWKADNLMAGNLTYSEQYGHAYFFREVEITDINDSYLQPDLLKKVTVRVKWSEAHRPVNISLPGDRSRQVELSVLLLNDNTLKY